MREQTFAEQSLARVKSWLASEDTPRTQIARDAGVHEKTVRDAAFDDWNPTIATLRKLEAVIPSKSKKRRSA